MQIRNEEQVNRKLVYNFDFKAGDPEIKDTSNEGRNINMRRPKNQGSTCQNVGRQVCSSHFGGSKLGKVLFSGGCQIFVSFWGRFCKLSDILGAGGGWGLIQCELFLG